MKLFKTNNSTAANQLLVEDKLVMVATQRKRSLNPKESTMD